MPDEREPCRACLGPLDDSAHPNARYCSPACRAQAHRERTRRWSKDNAEAVLQRQRAYNQTHKLTPEDMRRYTLMNRHGMTEERFEEMLSAQGGRCAICQRSDIDRWHVDHDHRHCSGKKSCADCVRGILCQRCNWAIGALGDTLGDLIRAVDYLAAHEVHNPPRWIEERRGATWLRLLGEGIAS